MNAPRAGSDPSRRAFGLQEPIAIVGMAFRLPGASDRASLWDALRHGRDLTGPLPGSRFPGAEAWRGGALSLDPFAFDPAFFGVPAHAADVMDPQIRLLLEVAVEAMEDAGIDRVSAGPTAGVYAGIAFTEYRERLISRPEAP
ncbi:MAG: beta-ketoacyl synthase N-terminal-like domain-containing protein, partial [Pseudomonadota bacterium]